MHAGCSGGLRDCAGACRRCGACPTRPSSGRCWTACNLGDLGGCWMERAGPRATMGGRKDSAAPPSPSTLAGADDAVRGGCGSCGACASYSTPLVTTPADS
eukprot:5710928-Prymnesium_polylepis.1